MGIRAKIASIGLAAAVAMVPVISSPASAAALPAKVRAVRTLHPGSTGADVKSLQQQLKSLHYDPGAIDGKYGQNLEYAVWAFQKVNGLTPTGTVGTAFFNALAHPRLPKVIYPHGAKYRVEVFLAPKLQYLVVYRAGQIALISHISSGAGYPGCKGSGCSITPTGDYRVIRRIKGPHQSKLGWLWNPLYFYNGYAIHGEPSVPLYPASHGCVRIPMHTSTFFPNLVSNGTPVILRR
ncbi:MAG: Peptidoglycan-binding domain 1 protein [Actinomycetia bacterium]|nr:Peptidoglycan-binding domain 1 protein [Actinomycetes bacterium]